MSVSDELNQYVHDLEAELESTKARHAETVAELESAIDDLDSDRGMLEGLNGALADVIRSALSDLEAIDEVPFGQVSEYVGAVITELRKGLV